MKFRRFLSIFMVGTMFSSYMPLNVFAAETANGTVSMEETASGTALTVTEGSLQADFEITAQWNGGFNAEMTLTNTGS